MREIKMGEKEIRVRAVAPALFYYKQEFNADLTSDLIKIISSTLEIVASATGKNVKELTSQDLTDLKEGKVNPSTLGSYNMDSIALLQIVWAMAKADAYGQAFPSFIKWLEEVDPSCIFDPLFLAAALEEAAGGFLRGAKPQQSTKQPGARKARPGNYRHR